MFGGGGRCVVGHVLGDVVVNAVGDIEGEILDW